MQSVLGDRPCTGEDVDDLPLIRMIVDEALRLYPAAGIISRTAVEVPFDATVAEIQTALEDLGSINGPANVNVTGNTQGPWTATFTGTLSGQDLAEIELDSRGLTQVVGSATIWSPATAA
ncbi:hypothetical protein LCGC14_1671780 [marine sediment metagenome]|uniref:Uncharacterized protein n=1 Tax=marine sediment metagenome TaxID=412755 RepID=A0A0F9HR57_9ZZZZ